MANRAARQITRSFMPQLSYRAVIKLAPGVHRPAAPTAPLRVRSFRLTTFGSGGVRARARVERFARVRNYRREIDRSSARRV